MESFFALRLEVTEAFTDRIKLPRSLFTNTESDQPLNFTVGERYDYDLKRFGAGKIELIDTVLDTKNGLIIPDAVMTFQGALRLYRHALFIEEHSSSNMMTCDESEECVTFSYIFPHANCVVIPAIPMAITPHDIARLLRLSDEGCIGMHLLKDSAPNRYMALLSFIDTQQATEFVRCHDGTPFSWVEPDTCHVLLLSLFQISVNATLTDLPRDKFDLVTSSFTLLNPSSELPTCPVCLDRLDATASGISTSICRHSYKCDCLDRWTTSKCSVCLISLTGSERSKKVVVTPDSVPPKCADCDSTDNIWICLICGHYGCGRYRKGHARQHYEYGGHAFVTEVGTQHVWDYAADMYVHRLLRTGESRTDFSNIDAFTDSNKRGTGNHFNAQELEDEDHFARMLSAQSLSQKDYFIAEMERAHDEHEDEVGRLRSEMQDISSELVKMRDGKVEMDRRLGQLQRLLKEVQERNGTLKRDLEEERAMSTQLIKTRDEYASIIKEKDEELVKMQEQASDLIAHMQAQAAMAELSLKDELKEGRIFIQDSKKHDKKKGTKR